MYMITRGNSGIPLIKLSEGYSYSLRRNYVTCVCGSHGEKLKPVQTWEQPFDFFKKEKLNAEFVSRTELIYVKVTCMKHSYVIDIDKYRLPEYLYNNFELERDVLVRTKPITESLLHIEIENDENRDKNLEDFITTIADGMFKDVVLSTMSKLDDANKGVVVYGL